MFANHQTSSSKAEIEAKVMQILLSKVQHNNDYINVILSNNDWARWISKNDLATQVMASLLKAYDLINIPHNYQMAAELILLKAENLNHILVKKQLTEEIDRSHAAIKKLKTATGGNGGGHDKPEELQAVLNEKNKEINRKQENYNALVESLLKVNMQKKELLIENAKLKEIINSSNNPAFLLSIPSNPENNNNTIQTNSTDLINQMTANNNSNTTTNSNNVSEDQPVNKKKRNHDTFNNTNPDKSMVLPEAPRMYP